MQNDWDLFANRQQIQSLMNRRNVQPVTVAYDSDLFRVSQIMYNQNNFAVLPVIRSQKKQSFLIGPRDLESLDSPKRFTAMNLKRNISEKWAPQQSSSRIKSLGDHKRSYSTLVRNIKPSRTKPSDNKAKLDKIREGCIPTVVLRDETETMLEFELDESQDEVDEKIAAYTTSKKVWLLRSVYAGRPPTVFFPYCEETLLSKQPKHERAYQLSEKQSQSCRMYFKFPADRPFKCVVNPLLYAGFEPTDDTNWTVFWGMPRKNMVRKLVKNQRVNHFPGCWQLGRKDNLWRNLWSIKKKFRQEYSFVPNTYILPDDLDRFERSKQQADKKHLWIMKPVASACGRGVKMISKKSKVHRKRNYLVCEYIANPLLINGLKFDLRLYILVSSYDPLRIYLFEQGLARFATQKYTTDASELTKKYIHLTNYAVNKNAPKFVSNRNADVDGQGSKWSLTALKRYLKDKGHDVDALFADIEDVIIKTCIASQPNMLDIFCKTVQHRNNCFELYGFDVIIDDTMKPWLLEVNVCPSLSSTSPLDTKIKHTLLTDTFNLIGIHPPLKTNIPQPQKQIFSRNIKQLADLDYNNCVDRLGVQDWNILFQTEQQNYRRGHFKRIFPNPQNVLAYQQFFQFQRYNNIMLAKWMSSPQNFLNRISEKQPATSI